MQGWGHGFVEMKAESVCQEYNEMRASFIMQYEPELFGEYAAMPKLKGESKEDLLKHIQAIQERQEKAMEIPVAEFDIDFHKFQIEENKKHVGADLLTKLQDLDYIDCDTRVL